MAQVFRHWGCEAIRVAFLNDVDVETYDFLCTLKLFIKYAVESMDLSLIFTNSKTKN